MADEKPNRKQRVLNLALAGFAGQVGFITLAIVAGALLLGLWLDNLLGTRPLFLIVILLASIPATVFIMYRVALGFVSRIKPSGPTPASDGERAGPDAGPRSRAPGAGRADAD